MRQETFILRKPLFCPFFQWPKEALNDFFFLLRSGCGWLHMGGRFYWVPLHMSAKTGYCLSRKIVYTGMAIDL